MNALSADAPTGSPLDSQPMPRGGHVLDDVLMRQVQGKRMAAAYDLRQVRKGLVEDPLIYGDDIIVVEQSASKTALPRFIESVPALGIFNVF